MTNENPPLTMCPECGNEYFILDEGISYEMKLTKDGELQSVKVQDNTIDQIFCSKCYKGFNESDFSNIYF